MQSITVTQAAFQPVQSPCFFDGSIEKSDLESPSAESRTKKQRDLSNQTQSLQPNVDEGFFRPSQGARKNLTLT
jgi:hypothetical protein